MNKLLLIDGNALTYRAYYATAYGGQGKVLKTSNGTPINAVLTFNSMLNKAIVKYEPTHIFVAFDAGKKTKRHDQLKSYKGKRKSTPPELIQQFPIIKEMLDSMSIKHFQLKEIEADDIIGTLAIKYREKLGIMVMSSDKDLYQLVGKNINMIVPQNGAKVDKFITDENFYNMNGFLPTQVTDMKGIAGDTSDNLPGVLGIGEKGAIKLLDEYSTLENIYEHIDELSEKIQQKLTSSKDSAFLCKDIATLMLDVDVPFDLEDMVFENKSSNELIEFLNKYELKSLLRKYKGSSKKPPKSANTQMSFDKILF